MVSGKAKLTHNYSVNANCMEDLYIFHDELGSGGFGKVKLATHVLSGEKVAIKVIDKRAVGEDLPRVTTELEALKQLAHQNVCRMFQYVETDEKFYIVMEYCNGGEMFDYIVRKERLEESEARHFFRQLVQAIAYVHSLGFAHRDLKPENLLLKEDLQLKVIDFGLCARPRYGLSRPLETCCGSPAYAAPELIQNAEYYGNEADIWSMGVLLYALLCGALPFEDESMPKLYKKIMQGIYYEPTFLSVESKSLLRSMLTVNPRRRITMKELLAHPWLNKNYQQQLKFTSIYDKNVIDEDVARELAFFYSMPLNDMTSLLKEWRFDYVTATYLILLQKKEKKQKFALPFFKANGQNHYSPTIHASLEMDMDLQGKDFGRSYQLQTTLDRRLKKSVDDSDAESYTIESPFEKSYARAIEFGSPIYQPSPQQQIQRIFCRTNPNPKNATLIKEMATPKRKDPTAKVPLLSAKHNLTKHYYTGGVDRYAGGKENYHQTRASTLQQYGGATIGLNFMDDGSRPKSVYSTPRRAPITGLFSPNNRRPRSVDQQSPNKAASNNEKSTTLDQRTMGGISSASIEFISTDESGSTIASTTSTSNVPEANARTPRSEVKTPRLRQRVFKSLERKADKMINLLTPRKMRCDAGPAKVKSLNIVTLTVTSSKDPYRVRDELIRVLTNQGMTPSLNGWKVSGSKKNVDGIGGQMTVEYEVVLLDNMDNVGVKRRRLNGDSFLYKRVCEEVLKFANL